MIGGDNVTIGEKIRSLRKEKGLTQKELGEKLGVSASMIGQYETSVRKPKYETVEKIAAVLGVHITDIVDMSDISPSLNASIPLMENLNAIFKRRLPGETITLSDEERTQMKELAKLISNVSDEVSNSSFLMNILRNEYISLFDKLNFRGKYLAVKMVSDLVDDPNNSGCPLCNPDMKL